MSPDTDPLVVETHISTLFFAGNRVYKLAKRVDLPFLRTIDTAERLRLAARELELNQRFSPDVYLGLAEVSEADRVVDRMIVMRRLPGERQLTKLLREGDATSCLRDVVRRVATAHSAADVVDGPPGRIDRLSQNWRDNFDSLAPYAGSVIAKDEFDTVRRLAETYLTQSRGLRESRITDGFVRDGHGDLTADDIYCLDDGPRILDCLAFDDDLRIDDVLNDIAFLVMDVHRLAGRDTARRLMEAYHEFSNEHHPSSLAHHYVAYRAHVRTKIACLRAEQGDDDSAELARSYHSLALDHLERAQIRIVLVGGGPGVGKTSLSRRIAEHYGYVHLATDEIRHDVAGIPHDEHAFAPLDRGAYDTDVVDATYDEQAREACSLLSGGHGVVLDASWASNRHRDALRRAIGDLGVVPIEFECVLDDAIARERIACRLTDPHDPSDATPELVDLLRSRRDMWPEAHQIGTFASVDEVVRTALAAIETDR